MKKNESAKALSHLSQILEGYEYQRPLRVRGCDAHSALSNHPLLYSPPP